LQRRVPLLVGLLLPLVGFIPAADAAGTAVCTISGTMNFTPSSTATEGVWSIGPAVINCQGLFKGVQRITGPGSFRGSGSYTALPTGGGTCLQHVGTGTVDYLIPTSETNAQVSERHDFILAGGGAFTTPSLRGTFQASPPYDGDCVTKPVNRATFVAQATMLRGNGLDY
jgi:hypothetical protein